MHVGFWQQRSVLVEPTYHVQLGQDRAYFLKYRAISTLCFAVRLDRVRRRLLDQRSVFVKDRFGQRFGAVCSHSQILVSTNLLHVKDDFLYRSSCIAFRVHAAYSYGYTEIACEQSDELLTFQLYRVHRTTLVRMHQLKHLPRALLAFLVRLLVAFPSTQ